MGYTSSWWIVGETMSQAFKSIRCTEFHNFGLVDVQKVPKFFCAWMDCLELRSIMACFVKKSTGLWGDYFLLEFCCHFVRKKHHAKKPSETVCFFLKPSTMENWGFWGG